MNNIRAIFFDIGDTLVYDDPPIIDRVGLALDACSIRYEESRLVAAFRMAETYAMSQYLIGVPFDHPDVLAATASIILRHLKVDGLDTAQLTQMSRTYLECPFKRVVHPDARGLLDTLRARGFRMGVISDWEATLPSLLQELDVAHYFKTVAVSAIVGVTKPNPAIFEAALEGLAAVGERVAPGDAIHVGDYYELDVAGARSVGIRPMLFDWKGRTENADCDRITSFGELAQSLMRLPPP